MQRRLLPPPGMTVESHYAACFVVHADLPVGSLVALPLGAFAVTGSFRRRKEASMRSRTSVVGPVVGLAAVMAALGSTLVATTRAPQVAASQTGQWVPLEYRYSITTPRGVLRYVEYRASDGSTLRENVDHDETQILSLSGRAFYQRVAGAWTQSPMRPQPAVMQLPRSSPVIPNSDPRVQLVATAAGMPVTFLEWSTGPKHHVIYCPELNMLEIWSAQGDGDSARLRETTSLVVGEPNVSFAPPEGAQVKRLDQPAGPGQVVGAEGDALSKKIQRR